MDQETVNPAQGEKKPERIVSVWLENEDHMMKVADTCDKFVGVVHRKDDPQDLWKILGPKGDMESILWLATIFYDRCAPELNLPPRDWGKNISPADTRGVAFKQTGRAVDPRGPSGREKMERVLGGDRMMKQRQERHPELTFNGQGGSKGSIKVPVPDKVPPGIPQIPE